MNKLQQLEGHREELFECALKMAKAGKEALLKLFLERLLPAKPKDNPLIMPVKFEGSLAEQLREVLRRVGSGEITCSAKDLLTVLSNYGIALKIEETEKTVKHFKNTVTSDKNTNSLTFKNG